MYPDELRYANSDEWVRPGDPATVGITYYAQDQLGDLVFIELPQVGRVLKAGDSFGTVESVKSANEIYSPVSGEIVEVNTTLTEKPEIVNSDPYGEGWFMKLRMSDPSELDALMDAGAYEKTRAEH